ncbi:hypothetical protein HX109_00940 [Galbibacter sp. BG1]|uniref:hypothetical protein n=1 Tax=Galbibacter sp. BG1 TaxID=1170699 RepID=UPI0015BE1A1F|nr:hypothetical protein [Galbibacter sp. BG1]QLE00195.1 hypothetical protein HX109_00940 [Galbibacter sp. BG1]
MRIVIALLIFSFVGIITAQAQDANNPIDPSPTLGIWNRFYSDEQSRLQILGNVTYGKWFYRVTAEYEFNYGGENIDYYDYDNRDRTNVNQFNSANFLVSRLFQSENGQHQFGVGAVVSYFHEQKWAGGVNFVSVSKFGTWKVITLATLQGGDDLLSMEFQPGLYHDFNNGWYFRSHPRMLFNFKTGQHEVPFGAGFGKILKSDKTVFNLFFEPQYDVVNTTPMLYTGMKILF